jgi:hypothetical protein
VTKRLPALLLPDGAVAAAIDQAAANVLRRFEIYSIRDSVPPADAERLAAAFRRCGDHIPELHHSVVGRNLSDQPIHIVWEHACDSRQRARRVSMKSSCGSTRSKPTKWTNAILGVEMGAGG